MRSVLLMFLSVLFFACTDNICRDSVNPVELELNIQRLESSLFQSESSEDVVQFLTEHEDFALLFLHSDQYPNDTILASRIFELIQNPSIDTLYQESLKAFEDFDQVTLKIAEGIGRLKSYYPQTRTPKIQTIVTGFYNDLLITNDDIIIGMEYFIGENATYKPQEIPEYILRRYTTTHLPSIVVKFISSQYVMPSKGETMLAEMIDHGKSLYLLSKLLPCTPERILIGYTEEEWKDVFENDEIIWANFVTNKWLYETNHQIKQKFIGERPKVYEIGEKCPGRIGQWLGWQIVKNYVKNSEVSIAELMIETDANKILAKSKYKPTGR